jgi:AGCS family alanine or glycine:cation symporter
VIHPDGSVSGGPMYYIKEGLSLQYPSMAGVWRAMAFIFALFAMIASFGGGCMNQSNTLATRLDTQFGIPTIFSAIIFATLLAVVIIGGIKRIGRVTSILAPGMALLYVGGALVILFMHIGQIPSGFATIFTEAFAPKPLMGGAAGSLLITMMWGIRRGLFSNEAGQGSAPIAHATAKTDEPVREGLVASLEPFIDTLVICTMTGLVIVVTGGHLDLVDGAYLTGADLTAHSFGKALGGAGDLIVTIAVVLFAVSTGISWSYYGDRATEYVFGSGAIPIYRWVFVACFFLGSILPLQAVWTYGDVALGLMSFPNLIALILLSGSVVAMTRKYFSQPQTRFKK